MGISKAICWLVLSFASVAICAAEAKNETEKMTTPCDAPGRRNQPFQGYNDKPVDACLGPNHFLFPANYFDDQIGPDFQANFTLRIQWPDLKPLPPGNGQQRDMETVYKGIEISPHYVDRVPIETRLERSVAASPPDSHYRDSDPSQNLNLMDKQPLRFGLIPYYVNKEKFMGYLEKRDQVDGHKFFPPSRMPDDWFLGYDSKRKLIAVIKCGSHWEGDGLAIQGDRVLPDSSNRTTLCTHEIVLPENKVLVVIRYQRIFISEWKRIEDHVRELFAKYRVS